MSDQVNEWPPELAGYVNFRDLGGRAVPGGTIVEGRIFRSDSLAHAGDEHVAHLVEERGVRTVVDLRGETEVEAFPNQPMADAGVTVHHIPLMDPAARERERDRSLIDWESLTLVGLYQHLLATAGSRFTDALRIICDPANHPLVFHCAAGKDRAGLTAAVTLGLLGVGDEEIVDDYARTAAVVDDLMARAVARARDTGRAPHDKFMTAEAETMRETLAWWHAEYGTIEDYMLTNGLEPEAIAALRAVMIS